MNEKIVDFNKFKEDRSEKIVALRYKLRNALEWALATEDREYSSEISEESNGISVQLITLNEQSNPVTADSELYQSIANKLQEAFGDDYNIAVAADEDSERLFITLT